MCGIVGFSGFNDEHLLDKMCDSITKRGPDSEGKITFPDTKTSLGMRRLSIIDIKGGDQPFTSSCGKVTLVYNGEIYNFRDLKEELIKCGAEFKTDCDTEVILHGYLIWSEGILDKLQGMFAFAICDKREAVPKLFIARDRVGMKPLYFAKLDDRLLFASDLKALLEYEALPRDIDISAVHSYLTYRFTKGPDTFFKTIKKLPAAHYITLEGHDFALRRWWEPPHPAPINGHNLSDTEAQKEFEEALYLAVQRHMIADVPVGIFLSGGIDSTIIAALMAKHHDGLNTLNSFTACFPDYKGNEGHEARDTAKHFGFNDHMVECRSADMANLPQIVKDLDEPVGDAIVLPMWMLAKQTYGHNKVVLSGEGADEILGGYVFHKNLVKLQNLKRRLPKYFWPVAGTLFQLLPLPVLNKMFDYPGQFGSKGRAKIAAILKAAGHNSRAEMLQPLVSLFDALDAPHLQSFHGEDKYISDLSYFTQLHYDGWLEDNILWKSDKMNMAHSIEGRMPFMDEEVLKAAARLPDHLKLNNKGNKWAMREYAAKLMPQNLLNRPKKAFYVPIENYQNQAPLRDLYNEYLSAERIQKRGLISQDCINTLKNRTPREGFLPDKQIFALLMLELWFEAFAPNFEHQGTAIL
jgi:asparagine synthase (glutamine-hydrolysing)